MMEEFLLEKSPNGGHLTVDKCGADLLRHPLYNKGTAFTIEERQRLGIEGLLPAEFNDIDMQVKRIYASLFTDRSAVDTHIGLALLQDRNEVLYYKLLEKHLDEAMPIVYTPTVGLASQYYSRVFRRGRGIFITPDYKGRIAQILRRAAPYADVRLIVVTDNEAILGIGDQGAGGMAISVGKLALYCAGAGIHPSQTLPISLDVGTENQELIDDPLYLGYRHPRLRGLEYDELVEEFVSAVSTVFPRVFLQWEDFRKNNALTILDKYRHKIASFNDDIQGTGAVATACVTAGSRLAGHSLSDNRILIYGAGAAGLGIARQLKAQLAADGLTDDAVQTAVLVMDSRGAISTERENLDCYKKEMAWSGKNIVSLGLDDEKLKQLSHVINAYKPTVLIGASGQAGAFNETVVRTMASHVTQPIILPMSNPTAISEVTPSEVLEWTDGKALIATGSPFDNVILDDRVQPVSQANNVFVFPGIGLGVMACESSEITDSMIAAAGVALGNSLTDDELTERRLVPNVSRLWDVCGRIAMAVAEQAVSDGVATLDDHLDQRIDDLRWKPAYPEIHSKAEID
ncbi:MAG: NAD-dependent malic enzyme [Granulosicoccus sp.]